MWQRFTEGAQKIVLYAQMETAKRGVTDVAAEHLLLGLLRQVTEERSVWPPAPADRVDPHDIAASLLRHVDIEALRADIDRQIILLSLPTGKTVGQRDLLPSGKRVIDAAYAEAQRLSSNSITPEFLLLGMFGNKTGEVGTLLARAGLGPEKARQAVASIYQPAEENRANQARAEKPTLWSRLFAKRTIAASGEKEIQ